MCRPSLGPCNPAETCNGSIPVCPTDITRPTGTVCRALAGPCDIVEVCTSGVPTCPNDAFRGGTTVCAPAGVSPICDPADLCSGSSPLCPTNLAPNGTTCDDGNACTGVSPNPPDSCNSGLCMGAPYLPTAGSFGTNSTATQTCGGAPAAGVCFFSVFYCSASGAPSSVGNPTGLPGYCGGNGGTNCSYNGCSGVACQRNFCKDCFGDCAANCP